MVTLAGRLTPRLAATPSQPAGAGNNGVNRIGEIRTLPQWQKYGVARLRGEN